MKTFTGAIVAFLFMAILTVPAIAQDRAQGFLSAAATATCAAAAGCVTLAPIASRAGAAIQIDNTFSGTVLFEATASNGVWAAIVGVPQGGGALASSTTTTGTWQFSLAGLAGLRARMQPYTNGVAGVTITASSGAPPASGTVTTTLCTTSTCSETVSGGPVIVVSGALTTAYAGTAGMTVIASGSTSAMTASTTNVPSIECDNISAVAGGNTVTIMDGNGRYFLGPNYNIPTSSNIIMNWNGGARFTSGINISAGAANVIQCEVSPGSTQ